MTALAGIKIGAVIALALGLFYPVHYTAAPSWQVLVVDELGKPIEGMTVRLTYRNYSVEPKGHEVDATTNSQGYVQFPKRRSSATLAHYIAFSALSLTDGVHASFGPHANVFTFGQNREGSASSADLETDWRGAPDQLQSRIVARRRSDIEH